MNPARLKLIEQHTSELAVLVARCARAPKSMQASQDLFQHLASIPVPYRDAVLFAAGAAVANTDTDLVVDSAQVFIRIGNMLADAVGHSDS